MPICYRTDAKDSDMYRSLQEAGYILIFKPTVTDPDGKVKAIVMQTWCFT